MAKKILVFSGKGGVGKSTVTVCLARALSLLQKKVLLVDADIGFRSLDLIMRAGTGIVFNWADVIENNCTGEKAVFEGVDGEPSLLTAPNELTNAVDADSFSKMLNGYDSFYNYIFIDAPAGADSFHNMLASVCDSAILVVTPDTVSVRSASAAADKLFEVNDKLNMSLVINRFNKQEVLSGLQMKLDDVIDSTRVKLLGVIPEDDSLRLLPHNDKVVKYAGEAFDRTARRLVGQSVVFNPKNFY